MSGPHSLRQLQVAHLGGKGVGPWGDIRAIAIGGAVKRCQWIEGDPAPDDSCKCLAPVFPGKSYCPTHVERARDKGVR